MPLDKDLLETWFVCGIFAALAFVIVWFVLKRFSRAFHIIWWIVVVISIYALADYLILVRGVPLPSNRVSSTPGAFFGSGRTQFFEARLLWVWPLARVAPGLLLACTLIQPQKRRRTVAVLLGCLCVAAALLLPERILARNREYLNDYYRLHPQFKTGRAY